MPYGFPKSWIQQLQHPWNLSWLVVYLPLWKIWKSVGMMTFPIWKKQCSKPPTSKWLGQAAVWRAWPRRSGLWRWDRSTRRSGWMDSASLPTSCKLRNCSKDVAPCLEYGKLKSTRQTAKPSGILYDYEHINNIIHIFQKKIQGT